MNFTEQNDLRTIRDRQPADKAKALLIEEDRSLDNLFVSVANDSGYAVDIAENGQAALQKIKEEKYDLILFDIDFSNCSGLDLIPEFRKIRADVKIISITANNPKEVELQAREHKVIYHLIKPFDVSELSSALNHIAKNIKKRCCKDQLKA